jgi:ribosome-binding ATPase YchF (GTP1/OBG family)
VLNARIVLDCTTRRRNLQKPNMRARAGAIHPDLARGFIHAEVIGYDDLIAAGTLDAARKQGSPRLQGQDYVVEDGDILNIRFNVVRLPGG